MLTSLNKATNNSLLRLLSVHVIELTGKTSIYSISAFDTFGDLKVQIEEKVSVS